jgi:hypothetical protein
MATPAVVHRLRSWQIDCAIRDLAIGADRLWSAIRNQGGISRPRWLVPPLGPTNSLRINKRLYQGVYQLSARPVPIEFER